MELPLPSNKHITRKNAKSKEIVKSLLSVLEAAIHSGSKISKKKKE
jgi:hypothetical protein